ncbi:two-component sensor histidine kinase [Streptomyces badius]
MSTPPRDRDQNRDRGRDRNAEATVPPLTRIIRDALDRLRAFDRRRPRVWDAALTGFWTVAAVLDYTSGGWRTTAHDNVTAPDPPPRR